MSNKQYFILSQEQIDKVGNAIIYLCESIGPMPKIKILKLIYILDEISIKKSGVPFFNLPYKVWKFGPVAEDIFVDLTTDLSKLKPYIIKEKKEEEEEANFAPIASFNDDEFTNNDIKLMDLVIKQYGELDSQQLVEVTHRKNAPWYNIAVKHNILDLLLTEKISNTEYMIDFIDLIAHDETKKMIYQDYLEMN
ncbi:SocA family protein [Myroides odoratimimus]|uniref:Panacea domain-containing protein n=1 Tax=Myroides odoratimimus TaxID=76832 RepID=UPI002574D3A5|nr:Panacea domain-containing protein [Myroides odoratimimus]MDM1441897.1 SocA family protein [Myroides odoratimimus]